LITVDFNRLNIKPGYKILDIGCGPARHTCAAYRFEKVFAVGADLSFGDIIKAKEQLEYHDMIGEHAGGSWGLFVSDITSLPFSDNYFDLVICSEVLEHIPSENVAINEIIRVLKPGNNLVVSVPRYLPERICWALSDEYHDVNQGHIRIYKKRKLIEILEDAGVKHWDTCYAHSLHVPYWWLKCLVGPARNDSMLVNLYHRFLTWDIMQKPLITRFLDNMLNPVLGKSLVLYLKKRDNYDK
jgi:SAM-dependent methyltransferase